MCIMSHIITAYIKLKTMSFILTFWVLNRWVLIFQFKIVICRWKLLIFCLAIVSIKRVVAVHMQANLKVFRSSTSFSSFSQTTFCVFKLRSHLSWCCSIKDCSFQVPFPTFVVVFHLRRILMPLFYT